MSDQSRILSAPAALCRLRTAATLAKSPVRAPLSRRDDGIVATAPVFERRGGDVAARVGRQPAPALVAALRGGETIGRPQRRRRRLC
jgi:hypothetical protein